MEIELGGVRLIWITSNQDPTKGPVQVRKISNITTDDKRNLKEHNVPGADGGTFQDLGRSPVKIAFEGSFHGNGIREDLARIRQKFKEGTPCSLHSDIGGISDITKVIIETFQVQEGAGELQKFKYSIVLREYKEPPPAPVTPPPQQAQNFAAAQANQTMASINQVVGKVLDEEGNPKEGVQVVIAGPQGEQKVPTDKDGIYRLDNAKPGKYKVTVEAEGYEGVTEEVEVTEGGGSGGGAPSGP